MGGTGSGTGYGVWYRYWHWLCTGNGPVPAMALYRQWPGPVTAMAWPSTGIGLARYRHWPCPVQALAMPGTGIGHAGTGHGQALSLAILACTSWRFRRTRIGCRSGLWSWSSKTVLGIKNDLADRVFQRLPNNREKFIESLPSNVSHAIFLRINLYLNMTAVLAVSLTEN